MADDAPQEGHNSVGAAEEKLRSLVNRIERLEEEKKTVTGDIAEVYQKAKSAGFDVKVLRQIIRERRMEAEEREEREALLDLYRRALGMLADTPLGEAAVKRAA